MEKYYDRGYAQIEAFRFDPLDENAGGQFKADLYVNVVDENKFSWYANPGSFPVTVYLGDYVYRQSDRWYVLRPETFEHRYGKAI